MKNILIWLSLICIPLYGFWTFPQWNHWKAKEVEAEKLQATLSEKSAEIKQLKEALSTLDGEVGEELLSQVPITLKQELIMLDLQRIVSDSGFMFDGLTFAKRQNATLDTPELIINFTAQGRKTSLPKLLQNIEDNKRFMGMDNLNFGESELNGIKLITLTANVYSIAQNEQ